MIYLPSAYPSSRMFIIETLLWLQDKSIREKSEAAKPENETPAAYRARQFMLEFEIYEKRLRIYQAYIQKSGSEP